MAADPAVPAPEWAFSVKNCSRVVDTAVMQHGTGNATRPRGRRFARLRRRERPEGGAALVEFAFLALPLFLLLFGIIEFGWAFFQLNDVRHGAREGVRLVAVNAAVAPANGTPSTQAEKLAQATCERMDRSDGVTVKIELTDLDANGFDTGDDATVTVIKPLEQLTNAFSPFLGSVVLDEIISTRLEQDPAGIAASTTWTCA